MKTPASKLVKITQKPAGSALSRGQKLFKKLIKKIDGQRRQLLAWQNTIPLYQKRHAEEFAPQLEIFNFHRTELVMLFDRAVENKLFNKTERAKLVDLILSISSEILARTVTPELKEIFNKYNEEDFDRQGEQINADVKAMMEQMFGMEIEGEFDANDPEAMLRMMAQQAQKFHEQADATAEAQVAARKKTAKQIAKEAKLEQDEKNISLSIRAVFRQLVSALHPDREPDAAERARKTDLMQRVNVAYGNQDLLQLLELQLEVEQIDESMINNISEDRLKHYNKILADQSEELEMEVEQNVLAFTLRFQLDPNEIRDATCALADLEQEIEDMQYLIQDISADVQRFADAKALKAWLKTYRIPQPMFDPSMFEPSIFDELNFDFDFESVLNRR